MTTKNITKTVAVLALILSMTAATLSLGASSAYADPYQPTTPSKEILIDKMVGKPVDDKGTVDYDYVDNLTSNDHTFKAGDIVYFRLRVKNTSQAQLTDVVVKDFEPSYFTLSNDHGTVSSRKPSALMLVILNLAKRKYISSEEESIIPDQFQQARPVSQTKLVPRMMAFQTKTLLNSALAKALSKVKQPLCQFLPQYHPPVQKMVSWSSFLLLDSLLQASSFIASSNFFL